MSTTKWIIDPTHSEVAFKVKHLVISTVTGKFTSFEGTIESETDDFKDAKIQKAFVNESKEFKLELIVGGATQTVYADANGNWLKKE